MPDKDVLDISLLKQRLSVDHAIPISPLSPFLSRRAEKALEVETFSLDKMTGHESIEARVGRTGLGGLSQPIGKNSPYLPGVRAKIKPDYPDASASFRLA